MREFHFHTNSASFTGEEVCFYGTTLSLYIRREDMRDAPSLRQLEVVEFIETVTDPNLLNEIWANAISYCKRVDSKVRLRREGIVIDYDNIGQHFRMTGVAVPELGDFSGKIFFVDCDCDWEPEHGMQLIVEDGKVIRCSPCDGLTHSGRHWLAYLKLSPEERVRQLQALPSV